MPTPLNVGGLPVAVYGLDKLTAAEPGAPARDLAVLFLLHGRMGRADHALIHGFADRLVEHAHEQRTADREQRAKDLLVVAFDQRNHGHREVERERNLGWVEGGSKRAKERKELGLAEGELDNARHATDMMALQTGTARDVSFLIDFLPPALFPHDERTVTDWFCAGISLGGHATWLALAHEPRISLGIPIIGSPSTLTLLSHRAAHLPAPHGPLPLAAPTFPASLIALFKRTDPDQVPRETWRGRRILVLSGADDKLVNFVNGGSEKFVERLREEGTECTVETWVQEKTGHACTPEMIERACEFVWRQGLAATSSSPSSVASSGAEPVQRGKM
ncbi:alpha/beta hydrolase family protein [Rhodotorula paludigena]|uniref:alpha/beta hydrolase family protein n=1 Tax=Rhodotorula paludigena TaxID=86838 RepID=UPI003172FCA3